MRGASGERGYGLKRRVTVAAASRMRSSKPELRRQLGTRNIESTGTQAWPKGMAKMPPACSGARGNDAAPKHGTLARIRTRSRGIDTMRSGRAG